jgi:hypothetical protein
MPVASRLSCPALMSYDDSGPEEGGDMRLWKDSKRYADVC